MQAPKPRNLVSARLAPGYALCTPTALIAMAETSAELIRQLEKLKAQAEAVRKREVDGVIERIKEAIRVYGITASDLGLEGGTTKRAKSEPKLRAKYQDAAGNTWGWPRTAAALVA